MKQDRAFTLPEPDGVAKQHSDRLVALIRREIAASGGTIRFSRFLSLALYEPGLGYYSGGSTVFHGAGDYITAPELSPLFSAALGRQIAELLQQVPGGSVLEAGAGGGVLAADLLAILEQLDRLPEHYLILEVSGPLRDRQRNLIRQRVPHLMERVRWLEQLPEPGFQGVILGNELLDAMPAELFAMEKGRAHARMVGWERGFTLLSGPPLAEKFQQRLAPLALADGYRSECNPLAEAWIGEMGTRLTQGAILLIDYGFPRAEYYHPERSDGTLMCHYRHRAHGDPFLYPGLQDVTAHVEFTAMAEAARDTGLRVEGFLPQAEFLINCGITELVAQDDDPRSRITIANQLKKLLMPGEMGELFKVVGFSKGLELPWRGFSRGNQLHRL